MSGAALDPVRWPAALDRPQDSSGAPPRIYSKTARRSEILLR
jgi:hypothetical protein